MNSFLLKLIIIFCFLCAFTYAVSWGYKVYVLIYLFLFAIEKKSAKQTGRSEKWSDLCVLTSQEHLFGLLFILFFIFFCIPNLCTCSYSITGQYQNINTLKITSNTFLSREICFSKLELLGSHSLYALSEIHSIIWLFVQLTDRPADFSDMRKTQLYSRAVRRTAIVHTFRDLYERLMPCKILFT